MTQGMEPIAIVSGVVAELDAVTTVQPPIDIVGVAVPNLSVVVGIRAAAAVDDDLSILLPKSTRVLDRPSVDAVQPTTLDMDGVTGSAQVRSCRVEFLFVDAIPLPAPTIPVV